MTGTIQPAKVSTVEIINLFPYIYTQKGKISAVVGLINRYNSHHAINVCVIEIIESHTYYYTIADWGIIILTLAVALH